MQKYIIHYLGENQATVCDNYQIAVDTIIEEYKDFFSGLIDKPILKLYKVEEVHFEIIPAVVI